MTVRCYTIQRIVLLMGPSGSGKSTVARRLSERAGWRILPSYTTRAPRFPGETGHIFVSDAQFDRLPDPVALTEFDGCRYKATAQQVEESDLYIIDPDGVRFFKEHYNGPKRVTTIYITAPWFELVERMKRRGDPGEAVARRLQHDCEKFEDADSLADLIVENESIDGCVDAILRGIFELELQEAGRP